MTINDIVSLIDCMSRSKKLEGHASTLVGPRTRGSISEKGLDAIPMDREGKEYTPPEGGSIPGCRYLEFYAPEIDGRIGAVPLSEALDMADCTTENSDGTIASLPTNVCIRSGKHGYELFIDRDKSEVEMPSTDVLTVILGPDETGEFPEVVWTWHPGLALGSLQAQVSNLTAVKIHNG